MICQLGESLQETCKWFCPQGRLTPKVISLSWWTLTRFVSYLANLLKRDITQICVWTSFTSLLVPSLTSQKKFWYVLTFYLSIFLLVTKLNFDTWEGWIGELDKSETEICCWFSMSPTVLEDPKGGPDTQADALSRPSRSPGEGQVAAGDGSAPAAAPALLGQAPRGAWESCKTSGCRQGRSWSAFSADGIPTAT